jgi:hypothetical protein
MIGPSKIRAMPMILARPGAAPRVAENRFGAFVTETPHPILTMNEAAAALRVSQRWLQDYLRTVEIPYLQAGNRKLFDPRAMEVLREAMRVQPSAVSTDPRPWRTSRTPRKGSELEKLLERLSVGKRSRAKASFK